MKNFFLFALLVLPAILFTVDNGHRYMAYAEDELEEELVDVEGEADNDGVESEGEDVAVTEDDEDESKSKASPDADTLIIFTKPAITTPGAQLELPAGKPVEFLVGFKNKGKQDFVLETLEASFRYPMDFNFFIQNFSAISYNQIVAPNEESTLMYSFLSSESFAGRPLGLNINLNYRDNSGAVFSEAVYNETVQIVEVEEGLDGETFFLYVFLAAGVVLLLVVGQQFLSSLGRKRSTRGVKTVVETGTNNPNNVDYDWLPKQTLQQINKALEKSPKSPKQKHNQKQSPKQKNQTQSPRQRKVKRSAGDD